MWTVFLSACLSLCEAQGARIALAALASLIEEENGGYENTLHPVLSLCLVAE